MAGTFDTIDTNTLSIGEVSISNRGAKSCSLSNNSQPILVQLSNVRTPFGTNSFEPSDRQNLDYSLDSSVTAAVARLDDWVVAAVVQRSEQLFGKILSKEQVLDKFKPSVTLPKKGDFPPTLRSKVNVTGTKVVRVWGLDGKPRSMPEDLRQCSITCKLHVRSLWFMGPQFGLTMETLDLQVEEDSVSCPFLRSTFGESGPQ
jgi:hypothetical protein